MSRALEINRITVQAPGRINIIGEHTDYNDGFVLPGAIDRKTTLSLRRLPSGSLCVLHALNLDESHTFDLEAFRPLRDSWANYLLGVVSELKKLGAEIGPFECRFRGDVPIGSGMSSSAALECSMAFALNELFNLGFDRFELMKAAQLAEHHFVGTKCGIMDQFASLMGRKGQVMLLDCRTLDYTYFPFSQDACEIWLINTKVSHSLASSEYNTRRAECEEGVAALQQRHPDVQSLRDVRLAHLLELRTSLPDHIFRRCHHILTENERVQKATEALKAREMEHLGRLMYSSHRSLRHDYAVSCEELDFLVDQTLDRPEVLGARMMGGGFGGCTINLVKRGHGPSLVDELSSSYRERFAIDPEAYHVTTEDGARTVTTQ